MPIFYTEVDPNGYVYNSMFITYPGDYKPREGFRLLPDNPPQPPEYDPEFSYIVRIEPVPLDAEEIPYEIRIKRREEDELNPDTKLYNELVDIISEL